MRVDVRRVDWELAVLFRISYQVQTHAETVVVEIRDGELAGRGEGLPVTYHGETGDSLASQVESVRSELESGVAREKLQSLLPPGGARNAVDCALWDLEAKRKGRRAWELTGLTAVNPLLTAYTLWLGEPAAMARAAMAAQQYSLLKLKLTGDGDLERVAAVHQVRPDATIIVDANQAWNERQLHEFAPRLAELGVQLIEQPLPAGKDEALADYRSPVPLCADESCQTSESLPRIIGRYQFINIKLDKTGGLTEALKLAQAALSGGLQLMVGCMAGSSLSMAPAFIIGQSCGFVDLDGPLHAKEDVPNRIHYEGSRMDIPSAALWG
jgi:L-Ala-D/L-Glu epimerase